MDKPANSATTILDLNDDCFIEVFRNLHITDLGEVADVCRRFQQNARYVAKSELKECLNLEYDQWTYDEPAASLSKIARMLRNFGQYAESAKIAPVTMRSQTRTIKTAYSKF